MGGGADKTGVKGEKNQGLIQLGRFEQWGQGGRRGKEQT